MVQTILFYNLLVILSLFCSAKNNVICQSGRLFKWNNPYFVYPLLILVISMGLRYNVGIDFLNYKYSFDQNENEKFELLYRLVSEVLYNAGFSFYSLLTLIAFVYFYFLYKSFEPISKIFPYCLFFFFCLGPFTFQMNGMRQALTFALFLYSIRYINNKHFLLYLTFILLAAGIHAFALILLPCYLLNRISSKKISLMHMWILYVLSFLFGEFFLSYILELLVNSSDMLKVLGYGSYIENLGESKMTYNSGIGMRIIQLMDVIVLCHYSRMWYAFRNYQFNTYFFLFYIGLIAYNIVSLDLLGNRAIYCLISIRFIIYGYLLYYWFKISRQNKYVRICFISLFVLLSYLYFLASIVGSANGCSPYQTLLMEK